jgi:hypothetical protein
MSETQKYTFEGFSQYRAPLCLELGGKKLCLVMDNGKQYDIRFQDGHTVCWSGADGEHIDHYDCLKADDQVYFINLEVHDAQPRTGLSLVLDFEDMLVTCVVARQNESGATAYFTKTEIMFGALRKEDGTVEAKRHGYTTDLAGKAIRWTYGPDFSIIHAYLTERLCGPILVNHEDFLNKPVLDAINDPDKRIPWPTGRADNTDWIKIKDGVYLLNFCEECYPEILNYPRTNCLTFVFDLKRMHNFGRYFGYNENHRRENYVFSAYGKYMAMEPRT